ncbi:hypothetical protein Y032_0045g1192 [Ancylostoma ceylanicum]|uniref:SCP domain-containing protein n=1 Tax=Ancylostoma ceylanicum TaxID=53326 RepID=A0A016UDP8_9BILA|nr:hypothetical protein Y032_0045g1192 [Ancylostoma ceylanicum]
MGNIIVCEKFIDTFKTIIVCEKFIDTFKAWDCNLEKEAKALLGSTCRDDEPKAPKGRTGVFSRIDIQGIEPELMSAVWDDWMKQIEKFAVSDDAISDEKVVYKDHNKNLREYLNLMRHSTTKIGCADVLCLGKDLNKYRAFCLTDKKPLKDNDVVYNAGKGGCQHGNKCPQGTTCVRGLCAQP